MIKITQLRKQFSDLEVLKGIDLTVNAGEVVSIVGASGAGKTTLLQIVGSLDMPTSGKVLIDDQDIFSLPDAKLAAFRNKHIGFVFQSHQLLPEFSAVENVMIPALIARHSKSEATAKAKELLDYLGLSHRYDHKPHELSGGEQQRAAVARALVNRPKIVLADEPSGNLDTQNAKELHELFFKLREQFGQTFLIATHNESLADMSDRKILMRDGMLI